MTGPRAELERRLLVVAPIGKDSTLIAAAVRGAAPECACEICPDFEALVEALERGAAAVVISEEALAVADDRLAAFIAQQPPWSDLPVLLLTGHGADSSTVEHAVRTLGNVTLLERPVRVSALVSAVRSAVRARERQYQTRLHLAERDQENRRKDEFIATLAHELRNPLAPIRNAVYLLRRSQVDPAIREMLERQIVHMVRLVDDLLDASRITHGKIELRKERVDIANVIDAAIEATRPLIEAAGLDVDVLHTGSPTFVNGDATRLSQIFSNLLNNAVKYTERPGKIEIRVERRDGRARVQLTDTGIGIAADALPHVFDMFVQADAEAGRARSGLGIGLTLARRLAEMHGGRVTAESAGIGKGSTFCVSLPLAEGEIQTCGPPAIERADPRIDYRILVVDDNRDAADSLGALLEGLGASVRVVYDGHAALEALGDFEADVVFLDLGMPGLDGFEVARKIREREDLRNVALVAITGWGQQQDRARTQAAGFDRHLVKPVDPPRIHAVLASVTRRRARAALQRATLRRT